MSRTNDGVGPDPQAIDRPWLGSYPPGVPPTYGYPDVLLTRFLDDAVRDFPDVPAVDSPQVAVTYQELVALVDRLAGALEGLGVDPARPLGLLLDRGLATVVAMFAAWRLGAVVVPVDPSTPDAEIHRRLADTGVRILLTRPPEIDRVRSIHGALPDLHRTVVTRDEDWLPRFQRLVRRLRPRRDQVRRTAGRDDVLLLADLLETSPPRSAQRHASPADVALATLGPDGAPLAFTHGQLVAAAFQSRLWVPDVQAGTERIAVVAASDDPHGLVAGLLDPVLSAATIIVAPSSDPDEIAERVARARPTLLRGPAELFGKLAATDADLTSVRAALAMRGSLDGDTVERFAAVSGGARLRRAYGPSAAAGPTHANPVYGRADASTIGLPVSDTIACVVAPDDPQRLVAPGEVGRLLVRGPQVTRTTWPPVPEEATADGSGWLDTGELAHVDPDGWFALVSDTATSAQLDEDATAAVRAGTDGDVPVDEDGEVP